MLLVTGATTFIGRALLTELSTFGQPVRTLLNPSRKSPSLPRQVAFDVALASPTDMQGVRAALTGVDKVVHLASAHPLASELGRLETDIEGTRVLVQAALDAGVDQLLFVSVLGADRSSAYPLMKSRAASEEYILGSKIPFTILRTSVIFGDEDRFTTSLAMILATSPLFFPLPGDGSILLQPLWVKDLATCISWALDEPGFIGETIEIGGPEYLSYRQVVEMVMNSASIPRILFSVRPPYLRAGTWLMERILPNPPVTMLWLDYLSVNRTTDLTTAERDFGLAASRMEGNLEYLERKNWGWELLRRQFSRKHG